MPEAAIALGSNLPGPGGTREENLLFAVERVKDLGRVLAVSDFHDTAPELYEKQPRFLNAAVLLETEVPPLELLRALLAIERDMGRVREGITAKGPRLIDLDLIFYDSCVLTTPELSLPHPAMQDRGFVFIPLAEVAPDWVHPTLGVTVAEMRGAP